MTKIPILLILFLTVFTANAQQELPKFPHVTIEDLKSTIYPKDSTAEAYIMTNYGNGWVSQNSAGGYDISYQYFVRIKVLTKKAFKRATQSIYLYTDNNRQNAETVTEIKGRTYNFTNEAMEIDELEKKDIFEAQYNKTFDKVSFTLPKVKEGSIIEYSYIIRSPFLIKPKDWEFQLDIPCERSEYVFGSPTNFAYRMLMQYCHGKLSEDKCDVFNDFRTCRWLMSDIPAFKKEKYVADIDDYTRKLHFELAEYFVRGMSAPKKLSMEWSDFDRLLLTDDDLGGRIGKISAFEVPAQNLKQQITDSLELAKEVYKYIQTNFTWDNKKELFATHSLKDVFNQKVGSSAELNLLLISLLKQVGITAHPVVISTRENGRIWKDYPMISRFNYTLVYLNIKGQNVLLDVTDKNLQWGLLPEYCMVGEGRLLVHRKSTWVPIRTPEKSGKKINMSFTFSKKAPELESQITYSGTGYQAINYRKELKTLGKEKLSEKFRKAFPSVENSKVEFDGFSDTETNLLPMISITGTHTEGYNLVNGKVYLRTIPFEGTTEHPFPNVDRQFPVDLIYPREEVITCSYTIPEGYTIAELPKGIRVVLPEDGGRFFFSVTQNQSTNEVYITSQILLKKSIYHADEYEAIRALYNHIVVKHNEMIVLQKK